MIIVLNTDGLILIRKCMAAGRKVAEWFVNVVRRDIILIVIMCVNHCHAIVWTPIQMEPASAVNVDMISVMEFVFYMFLSQKEDKHVLASIDQKSIIKDSVVMKRIVTI